MEESHFAPMTLQLAFSSSRNPNETCSLFSALSPLSVALVSLLLLAHIHVEGDTFGDNAIVKASNAHAQYPK